MNVTGNTILITGGGSGIGRALALAFHALGNQVIFSGRRSEVLKEVAAANPGMAWATMDATDADGIRAFAEKLIADHPALNAVINNAGIMKNEDIKAASDYLEIAEETIATNLLAPIRLTAALLPHFLTKPKAAVLTVSSGLAFVPMVATPTYSATKAAVHGYSMALREQLKDTPCRQRCRASSRQPTNVPCRWMPIFPRSWIFCPTSRMRPKSLSSAASHCALPHRTAISIRSLQW
jgi:uncharacterized oxidoreductase